MKFMLALLTLSIVMTACGRREAPLRQKVMGTWESTNNHGVITFVPDGTLFSRFTGQTQVWAFEGTWQLKGRVIDVTTTKRNSVPFTNLSHGRIIRADGDELIYDLDGQTISWRRK